MNMILYEDTQILVCEKPAGVIAEEGGMPALLRAESGARDIFCVHRLDRETAGLMVCAKTKAAAAALSAAIAAGRMEKRYLALVQGTPPAAGKWRDLLFRDAKQNKSYVVARERRGVREAKLRFETLETRNGVSLVRVALETGRSHQIRVQFASRGFPLLGDKKYGSAYRDRPLALYACELAFPHPKTGEPLRFERKPEGEVWQTFADRLQTKEPRPDGGEGAGEQGATR